jgi:hypothetical protein
MDLFSTLTFFPLVLQIGLFGMDPGLARAKPEANERCLNSVEAVALKAKPETNERCLNSVEAVALRAKLVAPGVPGRGFVKKIYGATAPY